MAGEEQKPGEENGTGSEELSQLKTSLEGMKGELEQLKAAKADLEKKLEDADRELLSPEYLEFLEGKKGTPAKGAEKGEEKVDFDEMTPAQIAAHFESKYKGDIEKAVGEITKRMDAIDDAMGRAAASIDLTITSIKHKDLGDALETPLNSRSAEQKALVDTMYKIAQENPTWGAEKCYRQAKLELKATAEEKAEMEKEKVEKERKALTEKPGAAESILQGKQLSKDEAASAAWRAAFGSKTSVD